MKNFVHREKNTLSKILDSYTSRIIDIYNKENSAELYMNKLHHFPDNFLPPFPIIFMIDLRFLSKDALEKFEKADEPLQQLSSLLYEMMISENVGLTEAQRLLHIQELANKWK
jgi:hypothetical protein